MDDGRRYSRDRVGSCDRLLSTGSRTRRDAGCKGSNPTTEAALATVTLTPRGRETSSRFTVARLSVGMPRGRLVAGEVIVPPGGSIDVTARLAGALAGQAVVAGRTVRQWGTLVFASLLCLLEVETCGLRSSAMSPAARAALEAAQRRAERADLLLKDGSAAARAAKRRAPTY